MNFWQTVGLLVHAPSAHSLNAQFEHPPTAEAILEAARRALVAANDAGRNRTADARA